MAKKLIKPLEDPPTASSIDDEEVETLSGEDEEQRSDSSSEEGEPKYPAKIQSTKTLKTPSASPGKTAVSAAKQGSDSDSDSETEPSSNLGAGKAIAVSAAKPKKNDGSDSPAVKSGKKRPNEGTSTDMHVKRAKKISGDDETKTGENNKKPSFQRLWSEEDEISLLQGMIDFQADTGKSPYDDMNRFYEVAKKSLSFEASKIQFGDKIRKLKIKYMGKQKKKGVESSHDKNCLGLAKYIWGSDGMALESSAVKSPVKSKKIEKKKLDSKVEDEDKQVLGSDGMAHESAVKSIGKSKKKKTLDSKVEEEDQQVLIQGGDSESTNWFEKSFLVRSIASLGVDESSVKQKWSKVPMETKKRIEEKCKLVEAKEFELLLQKTDILKDVTSVISETS